MNRDSLLVLSGVVILIIIGGLVYVRPTLLAPNAVAMPPLGPITMAGEIVCLPHRGTGYEQTMECAYGLLGDDGSYYGLKNLGQDKIVEGIINVGDRVQILGIFASEGAAESNYDIVGTIDIESHDVEGGAAEPGGSNESGLEFYPDLPRSDLPESPVSVKSLVEHRSALNEETVGVRGVVVGTLLGENACPSDRGMCSRPWIILADTDSENRNKLYDLQVYVNESTSEEDFEIGETATIEVAVSGSKVAVIAWETK